MNLVKTNVPGWVKDEETGVVINTNKAQLENLKHQRQKNRELKSLQEEVQSLRMLVNQICKQMGIEH